MREKVVKGGGEKEGDRFQEQGEEALRRPRAPPDVWSLGRCPQCLHHSAYNMAALPGRPLGPSPDLISLQREPRASRVCQVYRSSARAFPCGLLGQLPEGVSQHPAAVAAGEGAWLPHPGLNALRR